MDIHAFTMEAPGVLSSIVSRVSINQSAELCQTKGLRIEQEETQALWDTGATNSAISSVLVRLLGLLPVMRREVESYTGLHTSNVYLVDIVLPNTVSVRNVQVTEFTTRGEFDVIIGMDIITCGDFAISNHGRKTVVSFRIPSQSPPVDFRKP